MDTNRRFEMKKSILTLGLFYSLSLQATELNLWQVAYKAETSYMDGYTVSGNAYEGSGSYEIDGDHISYLRAEVSAESMSSGLATRDRSIKELIFEKADGSVPNVVFESSNISCQVIEGSDYCVAQGTLTVKGESKPIEMKLWVSDYEGKTWIHSDTAVYLSHYDFYQSGSSAIKVADLIELNIDFLEK